jgi:hypothetical protein
MARNYYAGGYESGPLYTRGLFNASKVSLDLFSFYLARNPSQSFVQIGAYDTTYMKDSSNLIWFTDLIPTAFWAKYVEGIRFGSGTFDTGLNS